MKKIISALLIANMSLSGAMSMSNPKNLQEAGNDAFGTIQEVMYKLQADPETDWSKVNLEALRKHLLEMEDMTFNVNVLEQSNIKNGLKIRVTPTTTRSSFSLKNIMKAHPRVLEMESGFKTVVEYDSEYDVYTLRVTTTNKKDVDQIRGLGYIGLMAYGKHHQPHHYSMAIGSNPHAGHSGH